MDDVIRLLARLILVPLGAAAGVAAAAAVIVMAHWNALMALANADQAHGDDIVALVAAVPAIVWLLSTWAANAAAPAAIGIVISEGLAIRSWIFHAANGALASGIGWALTQDMDDDYRFLAEPRILVAAGLAAGLAYWVVAGWTAGFWQPVRRREPASSA